MTIKEALASHDKNEAVWLLEKATGLTAAQLRIKEESYELGSEAAEAFLQMLERRRNSEPLQYILGQWDFMGLPMKCRPGVLIPRADTEVLAEAAIKYLKKIRNSMVLDMCTGSGCVGIALAKFCYSAHVTLSDINQSALQLARENSELNEVDDRLNIVQSDLFSAINDRFHCIVINPPYIPRGDLADLQEEVKHEPVLALDGGLDGLAFYRKIIPQCSEYLRPKGAVFFEVGADQSKDVAGILRDNGFHAVMIIKDLEDRHRVVRGIYANSKT